MIQDRDSDYTGGMLSKKIRIGVKLALVAILLAPKATPASAQNTTVAGTQNKKEAIDAQITINDWQLDNGLRVIHVPMHHTPAVSVHVWYHAGSKNEHVGTRGIAHLFEHMMFKGSKHLAPEKYAQYISAIGGDSNAFTSQDVTAYHQEVPKAHLAKVLELEAERMQYLSISEKTIASEREVVKEEKRLRMENSPIGRALEALYDLAYTVHPYRWTPAGNMTDLAKITIADCEAFYCKHYRPDNATLIVTGDVTQTTLKQVVEQYFGNITQKTCLNNVNANANNIPAEPTPTNKKIKKADWPSQVPVVIGGYPVPPAKHPDTAAIEVLSYILSGGQSSRLYKRLVRKDRIAMAAGGYARDMEHRGLFLIYAIGLPTTKTSTLSDALDREIAAIRQAKDPNQIITNDEIKKAKNQLSTDFIGSLETIGGVARAIGRSTYILGDPRAFLDYAKRLQTVTAEDVLRVAKTYLDPKKIARVDVPSTAQLTPGNAK